MFDILSEIDTTKMESELAVLESMCEVYDKAYAILEQCEDSADMISSFDIIQESAESANEKKKNIIIKVFEAIGGFFKNIGTAIAGFFKKAKTTVTDRLRKLQKKSDASCDTVQDIIDDENSSDGRKYSSAEDKVNEELEKKITKEFIEKDESSSKANDDDGKEKSKKTTIRVKEKKIRTRIKFAEWTRFLEYTNSYLEKLSKTDAIDPDVMKGVISTRPSRGIDPVTKIDLEIDKVQGFGSDIIDDFMSGKNNRKSRIKNVQLFSGWAKKYPITEVSDNVDKIGKLLNEVTNNVKKVSDSFDKVVSFMKKSEYVKSGSSSDKLMKKLSLIQKEMSNISIVCLHMIGYLAQELNAYSILLDIIEPIVDKIEKNQKESKK